MSLLIFRNLLNVLKESSVESCLGKCSLREVLQASPVEIIFEMLEREGAGLRGNMSESRRFHLLA
jgi:hypothetical protein